MGRRVRYPIVSRVSGWQHISAICKPYYGGELMGILDFVTKRQGQPRPEVVTKGDGVPPSP